MKPSAEPLLTAYPPDWRQSLRRALPAPSAEAPITPKALRRAVRLRQRHGSGRKKLRQVTEEKIKLTSEQITAVQKISELDEQIRALEAIIPQGYSEENYIKAKSAYDNAYKEQQKLPQLREELHEINVQLDRAEQENKIISEKLIEARETTAVWRRSTSPPAHRWKRIFTTHLHWKSALRS